MLTRSRLFATCAALACTATLAPAQTNLYLFKDIDLGTAYGAASIHTTGNPYFVGNNPSAIELGNNALYVGGWNFTGATTQLGLVKISNLYSSVGFASTNFNRFAQYAANSNGRGIVSIKHYRRSIGPGLFESRVACAADEPGIDTFKLFDAEPAVPALLAASPVQITRSGSAGVAFDWGADGLGFVYGTPTTGRPVIAGMHFGDKSLFGTDDTLDPDFAPFSYSTLPRLLPDGVGNTEWRGMDIDPRNGTMLASGNDSVVVALRTNDGSFNGKFGNLSAGSPSPTAEVNGPRRIYGAAYPSAGTVGRNVRLLRDYPVAGVGELIVWNSRPSGAPNTLLLANVVKFNKYSDGTPVTASYFNADGVTTPTFPLAGGFYDFSWDATLGVLAVCDFNNRRVFLLSSTQPGSCALPNAGGCVILPASVCTSVGGVAGAAGSVCPSGSCCGTTIGGNAGTCTIATQAACFSTGTFWTAGGSCTPNACPQPGACCAADLSCTTTLSTQCAATSVFIVAGVCSPTPCVASGTCCVAATCSITFQANCTGTWTSGGSCTPSPCAPSGLCCRGSTCNAAVSQVNCSATAPAGAFFASGAGCNIANVSNAPCCYADFNKVGGITVQDIFDFLAAWFAGSPYANTGGNGISAPLTVQNIFDFLGNWFAGGC